MYNVVQKVHIKQQQQPKNVLKVPQNSPCSRTLTGSVWGTGDEGQEPRICVLLIVSFAEGVQIFLGSQRIQEEHGDQDCVD